MSVVTRFAPSPTGRLHVGNIRTALHNFLFARRHGGRFLLRIDDTDSERSTPENEASIRDDLAWLGLQPDGSVRQSDRFALYEREFERLRAAGRVYGCYETPEELDLRRKVLLGRGLPPVYERPEGENAPVPGRTPHWRFRLDHESPIAWNDLIRGEQRFDPKLLSDPVVRRADGSYLYLLPSVIDDVDLNVTHIVRGEDHVSNSAAQLQMFDALGSAPPQLAHEALLVAAEGKLSKRLGSLGVDAIRDGGLEATALLSVLARLGTSQPVGAVASLDELARDFDLGHFGRAPAHFDLHDVELVNAKLLHQLPFALVRDRLPPELSEADWLLLRDNLLHLDEAADWLPVLAGDLPAPEIEAPDKPYLAEAAEVAEVTDWGGDPWHALTGTLKERTGRKGKALFLPLRLALTGRESGPEMATLVKRIGQRRSIARLRNAAT
ncbi:MAG: Glutamyl-tRNA(Gln) synthetase [uncultured Sphingomonas sp.]|uniref:Glutamate--tRNA ligase n=1 Tax=uncultured Sphingomonas sp. TaxID=158754 RepID=A0A6J4S297_9SPHN|nr:glutamate--tRNA ligase [uncultured Sphingomonas sp.]CAA9487560.1 MAG: Glutamyl-tRNA(Gln) synthetase [uncultured Sphingomonas sp.]